MVSGFSSDKSIRAWAWESGFHPHAIQARPSEADTELDPAHSDSMKLFMPRPVNQRQDYY